MGRKCPLSLFASRAGWGDAYEEGLLLRERYWLFPVSSRVRGGRNRGDIVVLAVIGFLQPGGV